jgi:DNA-binding MurR/RpiR family transcriptional regulator
LTLQQFTELIDRRFEALSPELKRAAKWVREHPTALGLQSMRQCALAAGVAPATFTRLAQALGLGGFDGLRAPVVAHLSLTAQRVSPLNDSAVAGACNPEIGALIRAQASNVASIQRNSPSALTAAAQAILSATTVGFLGQRASFGIAHQLHYTCDWLRRDTWLAGDAAGAWRDRVGDLGAKDVLVVVSQAPYTRSVVEMVRQSQDRGVPVLALTDSSLSPLAATARWLLLFDAESPAFFHSTTGALALAEALMNAVAVQGGHKVAQRLAERQQRHREARTYWERGHRTLHAPIVPAAPPCNTDTTRSFESD